MEKVTVKVYKYDELSNEAKERVYNDWLKGYEYPSDLYDAAMRSLNELASLLNCSFDERTEEFEVDDDLKDMDDIRLWKYISKRLGEYVEDKKSLTGWCFDYYALAPFKYYLKGIDEISKGYNANGYSERHIRRLYWEKNIEDLLYDALTEVKDELEEDNDRQSSVQGMVESCYTDGVMFFKDGSVFTGE